MAHASRFAAVAFIALFVHGAAASAARLSAHAPPSPARAFASAKDVGGSAPPPPNAENLTATIGAGLGWAFCPDTATMPTLEAAHLCDGLQPDLQDVTATLTPQPAANPEWRLWSGRYVAKTKFDKFEATLELLLSYAKVDGQTYAFVEGRLFTNQSVKTAVYFGGTANSWEELQLTNAYGPAVPITFGAEKDLWVPSMQFGRASGL